MEILSRMCMNEKGCAVEFLSFSLISKKKTVFQNKMSLVFTDNHIHLGTIRVGEKMDRLVRIRNNSISGHVVKYSCKPFAHKKRGNSIVAKKLEKAAQIAPGLSTHIRVEVIARSPGEYRDRVQVKVSNGNVAVLHVGYHVEPQSKQDFEAFSDEELDDLLLLPSMPSTSYWDFKSRKLVMEEERFKFTLDETKTLSEVLVSQNKNDEDMRREMRKKSRRANKTSCLLKGC